MRRLAAWWCALVLLAGPLPARAAPEAGARLSPAALEKLADEVTAQVVRIRHLPLKRPGPQADIPIPANGKRDGMQVALHPWRGKKQWVSTQYNGD